MSERWLPVVGFVGAYEVSDLGRVRSLLSGGLMKKQTLNKSGYLYTMLRGKKNVRVHKLVLEAFVGACPPGMETRHLDGNRKNNELSNLCYGTRRKNFEDKKRHGTDNAGGRHPMAKISEDDAIDILWLQRHGADARTIAESYGVCTEQVRRIRAGTRWAHLQ